MPSPKDIVLAVVLIFTLGFPVGSIGYAVKLWLEQITANMRNERLQLND